MAPEATVREIERLTMEMAEQARQEQWAELAANEKKRRALLGNLQDMRGDHGALLQTLTRAAELNRDLVDRVRNRRDDIGLLLQAFGGTTLPER